MCDWEWQMDFALLGDLCVKNPDFAIGSLTDTAQIQHGVFPFFAAGGLF